MRKLKKHIVKFITIVMCIMYVLMPIHSEIKITLHRISHKIIMADFMMPHNHTAHQNNEIETPKVVSHEHSIIDLLDSFIDTSTSNNDSNKPNVVDDKIDKHFHSSKYKVLKLVETKSSSVLDNYKEKVKDLFYRKFKVPPKKSKIQLS